MKNNSDLEFFSSILDTVSQQMAVVDAEGAILWVNRAWRSFTLRNGGAPDFDWTKVNYLKVCGGGEEGARIRAGILSVLRGEVPIFYSEYPCHSPTEERWFMMRARPLVWDGPLSILITHQDITERKKAEFQVEALARLDGLTGIPNRRQFDEFLAGEWARAKRDQHPLSLLLVDLDFFKVYNDRHGHLAGDECLRRVAHLLQGFARRPMDLAARYGGEEFGVIFGNTQGKAALRLAEEIRRAVEDLAISAGSGAEAAYVTTSVGVASLSPAVDLHHHPEDLIAAADNALYAAKGAGRNSVFMCIGGAAVSAHECHKAPSMRVVGARG